jgi:hypothetical protein
VSVALGMYSIGGVFVCADSHVVSTDGIVTSDVKLQGIECGVGAFVIGNAADDGNAANMVAKEILDALARCHDQWVIEPAIKKPMTEWHAGYTQSKPPAMQFVLAARLGTATRRLYFCEPPNTVVLKSLNEWVVLGAGAQVLDVLIPEVIRGPLYHREALVRAAYLMYRAKKDHVFLKGSETDTLLISGTTGKVYQPTREEMARAEALGPEIDFMLRYCYLGLLGSPQGLGQKSFLQSFRKTYLQIKKKIDALQFESLNEVGADV